MLTFIIKYIRLKIWKIINEILDSLCLKNLRSRLFSRYYAFRNNLAYFPLVGVPSIKMYYLSLRINVLPYLGIPYRFNKPDDYWEYPDYYLEDFTRSVQRWWASHFCLFGKITLLIIYFRLIRDYPVLFNISYSLLLFSIIIANLGKESYETAILQWILYVTFLKWISSLLTSLLLYLLFVFFILMARRLFLFIASVLTFTPYLIVDLLFLKSLKVYLIFD